MASFSATTKSDFGPVILDPRSRAERVGGNSRKSATPRQLEVLACIAGRGSPPPTLRELARRFGVAHGTVSSIEEALVHKGLLERDRYRSRGIKLTKAGLAALRIPQPATPGTFVQIWRCGHCGTARAGQGDCPECTTREAGAT